MQKIFRDPENKMPDPEHVFHTNSALVQFVEHCRGANYRTLLPPPSILDSRLRQAAGEKLSESMRVAPRIR